jgi:hypothetical protein
MAETNKEVSKANSRIDSLIANLPGIIPSSQPFADYSDFSLPDGPSHWDINPEHIPNVTDFQAKCYCYLCRVTVNSSREAKSR